MSDFPTLLSAGRIGGLEVRNRTIMAAMSTGLADDRGRVTDEQIAYYAERSRGGVGVVAVEFACVDSAYGVSEEHQLVFDSDDAVAGHVRLVEAIRAGGATPALQLQAPGQFAVSRPGIMPVAPSDVFSPRDGGQRARALEAYEVEGLVRSFAAAADRAMTAGYDAIELHGAHGYLLMAFLSPAMNHRDDAWGGDEERRLAFPTAVIRAIKQTIGDVPLAYRISGDDYTPGGLGIDDMVRLAPRLVEAGVQLIDVSTGSLTGSLERTIDPMSIEGWRFGLTRRIRDAVEVPVAGIGARMPDTAEAALLREDMDFVALGRPLLADPDWVAKAAAGHEDAIRPCTSCNWCADRVFKHLPTGCAENPRAGRETVTLLSRDVGGDRRVIVIGAGPGGLAAAIQADSIGFATTLVEAEHTLGGGLIASATPPHKGNLLWYRDYLESRLAESGVAVQTGTRATAGEIAALEPFAVILAQGAVALDHDIQGLDRPHVLSAYDLLLGKGVPVADLRGPVVVYGGGETGCELAELIAAHGTAVTLVTRSGPRELARAAEPLYRKVLLARLRANPLIEIIHGATIVEIDDIGVGIVHGEESTRIPAVNVVLAQGRRNNTALHDELEALGVRSVVIGDARAVSRIGEAVHDANAAVRALVGAAAEAPPA